MGNPREWNRLIYAEFTERMRHSTILKF